MKNILHFIGIFTTVLFSFVGNAQISSYTTCDENNDGTEIFDLTTKIDEVLTVDGSTLETHIVTFHENFSGAVDNSNIIMNPNNFYSSTPVLTIGIRVENINSGVANSYLLDLRIAPTPIINQPENLYNPNGIFDLTQNTTILTGGNQLYTVSYHLSLHGAQTNTNLVATPNNHTASSNESIYVRVEGVPNEGVICIKTTSFLLILSNADDIVYIPDANFKAKLIEAAITNDIAIDINGQTIKIDSNDDGEIQVTEALNVYGLSVSYSEIENMTGIEYFTNLDFLSCQGNQIVSLDFSNNINLTVLTCQYNNLIELNISNCINLTNLFCYDNLLTELNVSNNWNLNQLICEGNNFTELDFSNNSNLEILGFTNNPLLESLIIKNGSNEVFLANPPYNCPNLVYICVDESQLPSTLQEYFPDTIISSYCSAEPSGNYNTISGFVRYDFDNNGCDETDISQYTKVLINDGTEEGVSFTNQNGEYKFFTQEGTFTLTPDIENSSFFNITPTTETVTFPNNNNNEEIINFCITPNGVHPDLEVVIAPINPARPGFEATYKIVYRNKGNQILSQQYGLNFFYNQHLMSFVSATVTPDTQGAGGMNWSYENLMPFENRSIIVTMQINTPTDPENPVNIGDVLTFNSIIMPQEGDENVMDNTYIFNQTVVGAYDPNDITCIEGDVVHPNYIGEELHYVIRFENTGNYYAENVVVAMEIDEEKYDIESLRLLNTSHNANARVRNNILEIFFNQIMLDSGGHGNILLVMKSINTLSEGDFVQSKADIYFDYNYPIITNDAITTYEANMRIEENPKNIDLKFYPNPTTDYFNISSKVMIQSIELYDVSGRLVKTSLVNDFETKQNISNLINGVYILKIKTEKGEIKGKIIKQ